MQTQAIPQLDADEIVRILITENPGHGTASLAKLAIREGMPIRQAIETVKKYTNGYRCVTHNAVRCKSCRWRHP